MAKPGNTIPQPFPGPAPSVTTKPTPTVENYNLDLLFPPIVNSPVPNPKVLDRTAASTIRQPNQISLTGAKSGQAEPYIVGRCIADPLLIAVDDSGERLVLDMLWSVGEIDYLEGLYVDRVFEGRADQLGNVEHFDGTSDQAVSTIMAALKGSPTYDQLAGKAHSVARWQSGWSLQIQAWIRGLLLYDPRVSPNLVYSTNPALFLRRMLVDCGYTVDDTSLSNAADYCDEVIPGSGSPQSLRWQIGGQILQRSSLRDWIQTIAAYASVFVDIRGGTAYIIADEPRAANHTVTAGDMIEGTVRVTGPGSRKVPEAVTVIGRAFDGEITVLPSGEPVGVPNDGPVSYTYGTSGGAGTELTLNMPFFQTVDHCGRKAEEVYRRSRMRILEFQTFDKGLLRTLGDVGTVTNSAFGLSAVEMALVDYKAVERGRWYLKYEEYLDANYSDTFYTADTPNVTELYNPYNPPPGPDPTLDWQYNAASPQQPILTLSWTGVTWAYVQDYYVYIYSSESPQTIIYDSTFDGYIDHTSAGATHSVDLSGTPVVLGNTYTVEVYTRSNVQALSATPGTDSVTISLPMAFDTLDDQTYLERTAGSPWPFAFGDTPFTVAGWANFPAGNTGYVISSMDLDLASSPIVPARGWRVFKTVTGGLTFNILTTTGSSKSATALSSITADTWHFFIAEFDPTADEIRIDVDNGTVTDTEATTLNPGTRADPLRVGFNYHISTSPEAYRVKADELAVWSRLLTSGEKAELWNSGAGIAYGSLSTGIKTDLISWWSMDETSGSRVDSHGGHDLTLVAPSPVSGTYSTEGKVQ